MNIDNSIEVQEAIADMYSVSKLLAHDIAFSIDITPIYNVLKICFIDKRKDTTKYWHFEYNLDLSRHLNAECLNEFIHNKGLV